MHNKDINRHILGLDDAHPAKRFLAAFIDCRTDCVGRHHDWTGEKPIEQEWRSATDGRLWTFSGFAYAFLARDIDLDSYLKSAPDIAAPETFAGRDLSLLRTLMRECAEAAQHDGNREILELTDQVMAMLSLWGQFLSFRREMISHAQRKA